MNKGKFFVKTRAVKVSVKQGCDAADLEGCAKSIQARLESNISYEKWSCVTANIGNGKPYYSLKNDGFNAIEESKGIYAQCAAYRNSDIDQDNLNLDCERGTAAKA